MLVKEPQDWSNPLVRACLKFVQFKDDMDAANRTSYVHCSLIRTLRWLTGLYEPDETKRRRLPSAAMPGQFADKSLPFLCELSVKNTGNAEYERSLIHPQLVVSGTYNVYNRNIYGDYTCTHPEEVMDWSDRGVVDATNTICDDSPRYYRPTILPLYVATEGKNRVELFKRHRSAMYAWVVKINSAPVSELRLVRLRPFGVWVVSYSGEQRIIPFSRVALPIYRALGVKEEKSGWSLSALLKLRKIRLDAVSFQMCR